MVAPYVIPRHSSFQGSTRFYNLPPLGAGDHLTIAGHDGCHRYYGDGVRDRYL
jgi:hypothetical protein